MALYYLDTSALVKRYMNEAGAERVKALCSSDSVAISWLALAEFASALARRGHQGDLVESQRDGILQAFLDDCREEYLTFEVSLAIIEDAADLLLRRPASLGLRALDVIHVATARRAFEMAQRANVATAAFTTADQRLVEAATWAGLATENPEAGAH
jgi:predicted nucleic acid-binding protein